MRGLSKQHDKTHDINDTVERSQVQYFKIKKIGMIVKS
jgi:hypothetical protein